MTGTAPSHEIATYLDEQSVGDLGGSSGWSIYTNTEPKSPDTTITVYDTAASAPVLYDEELRDTQIQIRVRANTYAAAFAKQNNIYKILNEVINQNIGASFYLGIWMTSDIISLGRDENERSILTSNYQILRGDIT